MLNKQDIILLFLDDPEKLSEEIQNKNVPKSDEIRTLICDLGGSRCAYYYARDIDQKPSKKTRTSACKDSWYAYLYARHVDKKQLDETRTAACKDPWSAYTYAQNIDQKPSNETRTAACKKPSCKEAYKNWETGYIDTRI